MRWTPILSIATVLCGILALPALPALAAPPPMPLAHAGEMAGACAHPHPMGLQASFPGEFPGGPPHGPPGMPGLEAPLPPYLHGLKLSDEQQDRVFELLHAQAPQVRQLARSLHKAHLQLHELGLSDRYDEAAARSLVDSAGRAQAELGLLVARTDHAILAVLTAEQRKQVLAQAAEAREGPAPEACWH